MASEDTALDVRGLRCPVPVLKARKALASLSGGDVLALTADDPLAAIDVPNFCREAGHTLLSAEEDGAATTFRIAKNAR